MENDRIIMRRALNTLISDEDLRRQSEANILAAEARIKGIQQFINQYSTLIEQLTCSYNKSKEVINENK